MNEESPVDDVLGRWIPRSVILGDEPIDVQKAVRSRDRRAQGEMLLALQRILDTLTIPRYTNGRLGWQLQRTTGESVCYVPAGPRQEQRFVHGALYSDRVLIEAPPLPSFAIDVLPMSIVELVDLYMRPDVGKMPPPPIASITNAEQYDADLVRDLDEILDNIDVQVEAAERQVWEALPDALADLLNFAWNLRRPLAQGWAKVIESGVVMSDNFKEMRRDIAFREATDAWASDATESLRNACGQMLTAAGLAHFVGLPHVIAVPSTRAARDLIELSNRYFDDIPYGGVLIDTLQPPPRRSISIWGMNKEISRGAWFDELLVSLGPVINHLDGAAVCDLRTRGIAASLSHWLETDLNRVAFAESCSEVDLLLTRCGNHLNKLAEQATEAISASASTTLRERLRLAGIQGFSGAVIGYAGTALAGGSPLVSAAVAGIGFGLSALTGAVSASPSSPSVADPILIDLALTGHRGHKQ